MYLSKQPNNHANVNLSLYSRSSVIDWISAPYQLLQLVVQYKVKAVKTHFDQNVHT